MSRVDDLKAQLDAADAELQAAQAAHDEARERHRDEVRQARDHAAAAQRAWCDAVAAQALVGTEDAAETAARLGLELPED
jgi:hypothetical protein